MSQERQYSRRELLRGTPFHHFIDQSDDAPSTPDKLFEGIGECLSLALMGYLAWTGSQDQLVSYEASSESKLKDLPDFPKIDASMRKLLQIFEPLSAQAGRLSYAWENAYEDTTCLPESSVDDHGNVTTTLNCNHKVWNEPPQLTRTGLNYGRINGWRREVDRNAREVRQAQGNLDSAFDFSQGVNTIFYKESKADTGGQLLLAMAVYGPIGGAFCLYEETAGTAHSNDGAPFIDDKKYIKRRTLFKLAAAALMASKVRDFQRAFTDENTTLLAAIKKNTALVADRIEVAPEESLQRIMSTRPLAVRANLTDVYDKTETALRVGGNINRKGVDVITALEQTRAQAATAISNFDEYFSYNPANGQIRIPGELVAAANAIWATREVTGFVNTSSTRVYTRHLTDGLAMLLGLGTTALLGEKVLFPLSEKIESSLKGETVASYPH